MAGPHPTPLEPLTPLATGVKCLFGASQQLTPNGDALTSPSISSSLYRWNRPDLQSSLRESLFYHGCPPAENDPDHPVSGVIAVTAVEVRESLLVPQLTVSDGRGQDRSHSVSLQRRLRQQRRQVSKRCGVTGYRSSGQLWRVYYLREGLRTAGRRMGQRWSRRW